MSLLRLLREPGRIYPGGPRATLRRWVWSALAFVILTIVFLNSMTPERLSLQAGRPAPKNITATRDFVDRAATDRLRAEKVAEVAAIYDVDRRISVEVEKNISAVFDKAISLSEDHYAQIQRRVEDFRNASGVSIPPLYAEALLRAGSEKIADVKVSAIGAARKVMDSGVHVDSYSASLAQVDYELQQYRLPEEFKSVASAIVKGYIRPNRFINEAETAARRKRAADSVQPVKVFKDDIIVKKNEVVTEEHLRLMREGGISSAGIGFRTVVSSIILSLLLVGTLWMYLRQFKPDIYASETKVMQLVIVFVGIVVLSRFLRGISEYMAPIPAGTMLLATLLDPSAAIVAGVCMSIAVGVAAGNDAAFMVVSAISGTAAVYGISRVGHRSDLVRAGALVGLVSGLAGTAMALTMGTPFATAWKDVALGILNGSVISSFLAVGALAFFETLFNIMTPVKLLDLANPNHPLMSKLLIEAPGTYHHSVMVANLAEAAAEAVGANSLLARVGGYYHDIGKIKRPYFFIENQIGFQENPHDRVAPGLSTLIVTSHVKDGVDLARQYRLPERVIDFVREHHGTTLVSFFYSRAAEDEKTGDQVAEEDFRYEGPRPGSKETAIVMLADSVEAAVRSLVRPSPGRIETLIRRIVKDRLYDHQLDKCDLTLKDLDTISDTFMRALSGMFHARVGYPENLARGAGAPPSEGDETDGGTGGRPAEGTAGGADGSPPGKDGAELRDGDDQGGGQGV
ncbi:MAG: HDIG domain-containing protein [Firmicutes bacterium]|nr:HDIG domain-containing protein [Bacillota bacterium]